MTTLGVSFKSKKIPYDNEGNLVSVQFWDTAGQEKYCALNRMHFRGAHAALIVYDIT